MSTAHTNDCQNSVLPRGKDFVAYMYAVITACIMSYIATKRK